MMKKIARKLAIFAAALAIIWICGRYGWKIVGFNACEGSGIEQVKVTEQEVSINGFYPGSFPRGCVGYVYKQKGDCLYFGVNYSSVFGAFENGQFEAHIPVSEEIHQIYLVSNSDEYLIWDSYGILENKG